LKAIGSLRSKSPYLAVIPARGGSKRIRGKNLVMLGGKPLLVHTVEAALGTPGIGRVLVSTDDAEIARVAEQFGAEVPSLRPPELARDKSPMLDVIQHAVTMAETANRWVEAVVLLQPTSPFRTAAQIAAAIECFEASGADTVTAVHAAAEHPYYAWRKEGEMLVPFYSLQHQQTVRQALPAAYFETGAIYIVRRSVLDEGELYGDKVVPFEMNEVSAIDIDTPQDLAFAEFLLSRYPESGEA
jgi:CMP-N,N'-diacetyllegionaminic acid synthase